MCVLKKHFLKLITACALLSLLLTSCGNKSASNGDNSNTESFVSEAINGADNNSNNSDNTNDDIYFYDGTIRGKTLAYSLTTTGAQGSCDELEDGADVTLDTDGDYNRARPYIYSVQVVGTNNKYESLRNAIDTISSTGTVKLLRDVNEILLMDNEDAEKTIVIDINGYTWTGAYYDECYSFVLCLPLIQFRTTTEKLP